MNREAIPPASKFVNLPARFLMKRGGILHGARIAYETYGKLNDSGDNVILILAGLSPNAHVTSCSEDPAPGWWELMVGSGRPIDTDRWYVICVNSLGSCKGSTGPATLNSLTRKPYGLEFPELSIEDIADAAAHVVYHLGFERLACVIGTSMGGMTALALLQRHPYIARNHINISGAVHSLPFSIAIRSLQREAICNDPAWCNGEYCDTYYPLQGMLTARKLGLITYRSANEWILRFGRNRSTLTCDRSENFFTGEFDIENYLNTNARRFSENFDPNSYLYLSRSIDRFELSPGANPTDINCELAKIKLDNALVLGVGSDILFPKEQQIEIAEGLNSGGTKTIIKILNSIEGHDAFLVDINEFGNEIKKFLFKI
ncbi:homoserine O-acetyltransferase [Salmonella enterica subsp. enterica]|nr:homoserine O-acetyltransferase [Salmonella enterica subsp. enterica serovar Mikawasima]EDN7229172.1 homoserine O-acetyltransferase [Salmonella enterica subsp. enterica serovar Mikawasima]